MVNQPRRTATLHIPRGDYEQSSRSGLALPKKAKACSRAQPARPPSIVPAPDTSASATQASYRSTLWSQGLRLICRLAGVVVLARLVSPEEHGLFAMAASFTLLISWFRDLGTGTAAVQAPELTAGQQTALFWLHLGLGILLMLVTLACTGLVGMFYHETRVVPLLALMSLSLLLNGVGAWPRVLLNRELRFRELNRIETLGATVGTAGMILAALLGAGGYAFAWFLLLSEGTMCISWRFRRWRPQAPADWRGLRHLLRTGAHLTGSNILTQILAQLDAALMGRWFGAIPLGFYNRAAQLLVQPSLLIATPFSQVLFATLSRLGPTASSFVSHLRETANAIAHLTLPVVAVCCSMPNEVVRVVLGSDWPGAAPLLRWLALARGITLLGATVQPLCVAQGRVRRLVGLSAVALAVTAGALWFGRTEGPSGLAAAVAIAAFLMLGPRLWAATRGGPVTLSDYGHAFTGPILQSIWLAAGLVVGKFLAPQFTGNEIAIAAVAVFCGCLSYGLGLLLRPATRAELRRIRPLFKRPASA